MIIDYSSLTSLLPSPRCALDSTRSISYFRSFSDGASLAWPDFIVPSLRVVESSDWAMCHGPVKSTSLLLFTPNFTNQEHLDFGRCSSATLDFSSRSHLLFLLFCSLIPCAFAVIYYVLQLIKRRCTTTMCGSHHQCLFPRSRAWHDPWPPIPTISPSTSRPYPCYAHMECTERGTHNSSTDQTLYVLPTVASTAPPNQCLQFGSFDLTVGVLMTISINLSLDPSRSAILSFGFDHFTHFILEQETGFRKSTRRSFRRCSHPAPYSVAEQVHRPCRLVSFFLSLFISNVPNDLHALAISYLFLLIS